MYCANMDMHSQMHGAASEGGGGNARAMAEPPGKAVNRGKAQGSGDFGDTQSSFNKQSLGLIQTMRLKPGMGGAVVDRLKPPCKMARRELGSLSHLFK